MVYSWGRSVFIIYLICSCIFNFCSLTCKALCDNCLCAPLGLHASLDIHTYVCTYSFLYAITLRTGIPDPESWGKVQFQFCFASSLKIQNFKFGLYHHFCGFLQLIADLITFQGFSGAWKILISKFSAC